MKEREEDLNISRQEKRKGQVTHTLTHTHTHTHLPLPGQLPLHSGWSRCCMLPICTERPKRTGSPSAPEEEGREGQVWLFVVADEALYCRICVWLCFVFLLTAVWAVMWVQPTTLAPARGFSPWARFLRAMRAGISDGGGNTTNNTWAERGISWMVKEFPSFNPSNTSSLIHWLVQLKKSRSANWCVCVYVLPAGFSWGSLYVNNMC